MRRLPSLLVLFCGLIHLALAPLSYAAECQGMGTIDEVNQHLVELQKQVNTEVDKRAAVLKSLVESNEQTDQYPRAPTEEEITHLRAAVTTAYEAYEQALKGTDTGKKTSTANEHQQKQKDLQKALSTRDTRVSWAKSTSKYQAASQDIQTIQAKMAQCQERILILTNIDTAALGKKGTASTASADIVNLLLGLAGTVGIITIVIGGFMMVMSAANPDLHKKAKNVLVSAVIGLVIVFSAYLLVRFVQSLL